MKLANGVRPPGVILAGGLARRMGGGDKGLLPLGPGTLLDAVIGRLRPQVDGLALNANGDPERFARCGLPVIPDATDDRPGPLAGVLAGLDWAASRGASAIVTAAADTPFLPTDLVARLTAADAPLVLAATREAGQVTRHPTFGLWPVALREDLRAALAGGLRKIVLWTDMHDAATVEFEDPTAFFNVNTPQDAARAQAMAAEAR